MGTPVVVGGVTYTVPAYNDTGWGQGAGSVQNLLIALAAQVASTPAFMQTVSVTTTPVTMVTGKTYLVNTSTLAITLDLPTPVVNLWFIVKDATSNAINNNITIHRAASETIDGNASDLVIASSNAGVILYTDGTNWFTTGMVGA